MNASSDHQRGTTVTVTVDSRAVEVDTTPLPCTESTTFLIMKEPPVRRLNVLCHRDVAWTQNAAQRLAQFLGAPVVS